MMVEKKEKIIFYSRNKTYFLVSYILSYKNIHCHNRKNNAGFQKLWVCKSDSVAMIGFAYRIETRRGN